MGIINNALNKKIDNSNIQKHSSGTGKILSYDRQSGTAEVSYKIAGGNGKMKMNHVPVVISQTGTAGYDGIKPGDKCMLNFINDNPYKPIVVGTYGSDYDDKTMSDSGAYIVDSDSLEGDKPEEVLPMSEDWIDQDPVVGKYINEYSEYIDSDATKMAYTIFREAGHFKTDEFGMVNIMSGSGIKFKQNGDIDIFTGNNNGIRLSPENGLKIFGLE